MHNIESDGERVWVCIDGASAGRFGRHSFDVYVRGEIGDDNKGRTFGKDETLTHAWEAWRATMRIHHDIDVSQEHRPTRIPEEIKSDQVESYCHYDTKEQMWSYGVLLNGEPIRGGFDDNEGKARKFARQMHRSLEEEMTNVRH